MRAYIRKRGNGASVKIPAPIMAAAALRIDQQVDVRVDAGRVIIEPILAPSYNLDDLIARLAPDTFPDEVDFGRTVGGEGRC